MVREERKSKRIKRNDPAELLSLADSHIIECIIKDISEGGARLEIAVPEVVPDFFKLKINKSLVLPRCAVRWRSGNEVGVEFYRRIRIKTDREQAAT